MPAAAPLHEVADQLGAGVVDAAALAPALVGEPEQLTLRTSGSSSARRDVAVAALVVAIVAVGEREAQRQQPLVDVAEMADLEPREVDTGLGLVGVAAERDEGGRQRGVGDRGVLERLGTRQAGGREQLAVVGRHAPGALAGAHRLDQGVDVVPERGAMGSTASRSAWRARRSGSCCAAGRSRGPSAGSRRSRRRAGRGRGRRRRGRGLELDPNLVVGEVAALGGGPAAELAAEDRQDLLAEAAVEALAQLGAVVARLGEHREQPPSAR